MKKPMLIDDLIKDLHNKNFITKGMVNYALKNPKVKQSMLKVKYYFQLIERVYHRYLVLTGKREAVVYKK